MNEEELSHEKKYDPVFLYIRADERNGMLEAEQHDQGLALQSVMNQIKALEERVNMGVARTGNETKIEVQDLKTRMALVEKAQADTTTRLFDKDTGMVKQFDDSRTWQKTFSNNVTTFFIVQVAGALILWAVKHFR